MPEKSAELELTEIEIPFFVTGYYKPNTAANLSALRLGFTYNLYGTDRRTRYIQNPQDNYDQFVHQVEASLNDVTVYIGNMLSVLANMCVLPEDRGVLKINVQGWADPRGISAGSEYLGEDIDDEILGIRVRRGTRMDNNLLSKLRAYFTAKHFETELAKRYGMSELSKLVRWKIEGMGIDTTEDIDDELKRRVKIYLQFEE